MKENRISKIMNRLFHIVILAFLGTTFIGVLFSFVAKKTLSENIVGFFIIPGFVCFSVIAAIAYYYSTKSSDSLKKALTLSDNQAKLILFAGVFVIFLIQLYVGYKLRNYPVTDVEILNKYILDFAKTGNFDLIQSEYSKGNVYLVRYPNNLAITFLMSFISRIAYIIFGYVPRFLSVIVNCIAINLGILFTVLIAQKLLGNKTGFYTLGLCGAFPPFYTYTAFCYTDSLSLPLLTGGIYFLLLALKNDKKIKLYVYAIISGIIVFLGLKMKASVVFIIIDAVIYCLLKLDFKRFASVTLALIIGFIGSGAIYGTTVDSMHLATKEQINESRYPYTHWIMMGLKGKGGYHSKDSQYTASFPNIQEKTQANLKEIKNRIKQKGINGLIYHTGIKVLWTWGDGTYFINHHIENPVQKNFLHSIVLERGKYHNVFYAYSSIFHLMLLFFMLMSIIKGLKNPTPTFSTFLKGLVFTIFLFLIIWETRSRYLFNFTPVFILLSVDGVDYFVYLFRSFISKLHLKKI